MREFIFITKALADKNRIRIILALKEKELCVCQIIHLLGLAPSTVSKHLSILNRADLIESRKNGRWVYYHLREDNVVPAVQQAIEWVVKSLADDIDAAKDKKRLEEILIIDPEKLCESYDLRSGK